MSAVNTEEGKNAADCGCISSSVLNASFKACIWSACTGVSYESGLGAGTGVDEQEKLAASRYVASGMDGVCGRSDDYTSFGQGQVVAQERTVLRAMGGVPMA